MDTDYEEKLTIARYCKALEDLANENPRFESNYHTFTRRWDDRQCMRWITRIERDAANGAKTIAQDVVLRVVMNRLEEGDKP